MSFVFYAIPCAGRERRDNYNFHENFCVPLKLAKYDRLAAKWNVTNCSRFSFSFPKLPWSAMKYFHACKRWCSKQVRSRFYCCKFSCCECETWFTVKCTCLAQNYARLKVNSVSNYYLSTYIGTWKLNGGWKKKKKERDQNALSEFHM